MKTIAEQIREVHSGWSDKECSLCERPLTNAALSYSMRFYGKPLCKSCQRVGEPLKKRFSERG